VFTIYKNLTNLSKKNIRSQINKNGGVYQGFSIDWKFIEGSSIIKVNEKSRDFSQNKILLRFYVKSE